MRALNGLTQRKRRWSSSDRQPGLLVALADSLHALPVIMVLLAATGFTIAAAGGWPRLEQLLPFLGAVLLTQLAISLHNGVCDLALDSQTKPWRLLPRRLITPATAIRLAGLLLVAGILLVAPMGPWPVVLVLVGTCAGFAYNAWFKRSRWTWLPFWLGLPALPLCAFAVVERFEPRHMLVYVVGAPLVGSIYLADTLDDLTADTAAGVAGLAHRLGPRRARAACWILVLLALGLAWLLWPVDQPSLLLYTLSTSLLLGAIVLDRMGARRGHWLGIMSSATLLAVAWVAAAAQAGPR